jgi:hypothetical protein
MARARHSVEPFNVGTLFPNSLHGIALQLLKPAGDRTASGFKRVNMIKVALTAGTRSLSIRSPRGRLRIDGWT